LSFSNSLIHHIYIVVPVMLNGVEEQSVIMTCNVGVMKVLSSFGNW